MHTQIWRPVEALRHRQFARHLAGVTVAVEMRKGREGDGAKPVLHTDAAQDFHRVRHHLNAGADAPETLRLLVDLDGKARLPQRRRDREPAHACANHGDGKFVVHFTSIHIASFTGVVISALTRIFDTLWRRTRNPEQMLRVWIPGSRMKDITSAECRPFRSPRPIS